jgi:hypothetical protein
MSAITLRKAVAAASIEAAAALSPLRHIAGKMRVALWSVASPVVDIG